jgi:dUTP pyrophosphatase
MEVLRLHEHAILPSRGTSKSAGYDLSSVDELVIQPGERKLVGTGISIGMPYGVYGRVAPRSGLAVKHGIQVGAGVIDPDYTGEIKVLLFNHGSEAFQVKVGDRIAQLVLERFESVEVLQVDSITDTERGSNGFGSTGINIRKAKSI